jgi:hypothetical protein
MFITLLNNYCSISTRSLKETISIKVISSSSTFAFGPITHSLKNVWTKTHKLSWSGSIHVDTRHLKYSVFLL